MSLQNIIKERLANSDIDQIAKSLCYKPEQLNHRIKITAESPYLGLDGSYYDFKYSQIQFAKKLCRVLDIPSLLYEKVIGDIQSELTEKDLRFKPYIFIDTNFVRKSEPIFALAALESRRHIKIDYEISKLSLNEQIEHIQNIIRKHYKKHQSLLMWGEVKQYVYYSENMVLIFSTDGGLLDVVGDYARSGASISL